MYLEERLTSRDSWKFTYLGKDLLPYAEARYKEWKEKETTLRQELAAMMEDRKMSLSDEKVQKAKTAAEKAAMEAERCLVWKHEFKRQPDKDYHLAMGDVVYFGIV